MALFNNHMMRTTEGRGSKASVLIKPFLAKLELSQFQKLFIPSSLVKFYFSVAVSTLLLQESFLVPY